MRVQKLELLLAEADRYIFFLIEADRLKMEKAKFEAEWENI